MLKSQKKVRVLDKDMKMTQEGAVVSPLVGAKTLYHRLGEAVNEKDVENAWREEFARYVPEALITSPYNTDGILEAKTLHILLEFKYDLDFTQRPQVMQPVIQGLMYLKKFYDAGNPIPTSVFVGDKNECFMLSTTTLMPYLSREDVDWDAAPSSAWRELSGLYREMIADPTINPYVLAVRERGFYFQHVIDKLASFHIGDIHQIPITIHNIAGIFTSWQERVLNDPDASPQASVGAFVASVLGEAYLHPKKANTLVSGASELRVNSQQHEAFFDWFKTEYRVSEKRGFTAIKDRLIEDETRRRGGDFYTPTPWVDEAHKYLDNMLGENWRDEWAVWDCAAGTGNLTRDYQFKELYLSTLYPEDVETIQSMGYNPGAEIFQFDFLNDPIPGDGLHGDFIEVTNPLPVKLLRALRSGKKFVFLINPPFGTAKTNPGMADSKSGIADTAVNKQMKVGAASQQLYAQFMWRITEIVKRFGLEDSVLALYSTPLFMSGGSFDRFRDYFYGQWEFNDGFLFRADEFNGTSSSWGCSYTLWRKGMDQKVSFDLNVKKRNETGQIVGDGLKAFYYPQEIASEWVKAPRDMWWGKADKDVPHVSSAVEIKYTGYCGRVEESLGYMHNAGNNIMHNQQLVGLYSWPFSNAHGVHVFPENFRRCLALFTARKTIKGNWINDKDEYCAPNEVHPEYEQWVNDCHVYSLFHSSSQQSSLRNIKHKGKDWQIENEFFWLSHQEMVDLADEHGFNDMYQDAQTYGADQYMYKQLEGLALSPDAQEVLEESRNLVRQSMPFRAQAHYARPEMHLQAWDAGWYQIRKGILEDYFPKEYEDFVAKYKALEDRLRDGVFKFGFLK